MPRNSKNKGQKALRGVRNIHRASQGEAASVFGVARQTFAAWDCPRNDDKTYSIPDVIRWRTDREAELGGGGNSPALERYRLAKAEQAEIELAQAKRELVSMADFRQWLGAWSRQMERYAMEIQKRGWRDAYDLFVARVEAAKREVKGALD